MVPLMFVPFISNFLCMCCNSVDSAHGDFEVNQTKIRGGCQSRRKVVPHDSKSDLPLVPSKKISATNDVTSWKDSASMYLMFTMT